MIRKFAEKVLRKSKDVYDTERYANQLSEIFGNSWEKNRLFS